MKLSLLLLNVISLFGLVAIAPVRANPAPPTGAPTASMPVMPPPVMPPVPSAIPGAMPESAATPVNAPVVAPVSAPVVTPVADTVAIPVAPTTDRISNQEVTILSPTTQSVLNDRAATIVLQFSADKKIVLIVNGQPVDAKQVGRTENDSKTNRITQTWYGVVLKEGDNVITANLLDSNGTITSSTNTLVQVRGAATKLKVSSQETRIPADGRSIATITGEMLDEAGNRSNRDGIVTLSANSGEFVGVDANPDQPGFQVKVENGQFTAKLKSSLEAKTVNILATSGDMTAYTTVGFETNLRSSIATGVIDVRLGARGTNFHRSFRDFLPVDGKNGTQLDVRASVFASGKIGEWLFTGAYNSDRALNTTCDNKTALFRTQQACETQYPVYGDSSQSDILTPSTDSLYIKLEKTSRIAGAGSDYAMWGDYNTDEFATRSQEYTSVSRQLHGLKGNYNIGNLQVSGLYANNVQGYQRDTISPDGTAGYYFVSRRLMLEGSEEVYLETEELNRPGTVIERSRLTRGPDYEVDYSRGTLLFRKPVLRTDVGTDGTPLVRRIVTTYQYEQESADNKIYAARARYHLSRTQGQESWLGATYWKEDQGVRNFELYGIDAMFPLGNKGSIIAEYARSNQFSDILGQTSGSAFRVEANGEIANGITGRAYYRSTDPGFANNATVSFTPGQTRYGAQVTAKVGEQTNVNVKYDRETNRGTSPQPLQTTFDLLNPRVEALPGTRLDNDLTTISAGVQQKIGSANLSVDWLHRDRTDRVSPSNTGSSDQLRTRLALPITSKLNFVAQNETTLSNKNDAFYPDRTLLGLDWQLMPGINVQLAQQFFTSGQYAGQNTTSLGIVGDYKLFPETTLSARYGIVSGAGGSLSTQGAIGIKQGIKLSPGLQIDLAYEHVLGNFSGQTATGIQTLQPFAPGQSASSLGLQGGDSYSVGINYNDSARFQANARLDHRSSSSGSNTVISAGVTGKLSPALTAMVRFQQASAANVGIVGLGTTTDFKLGLAYRDPNSDVFNALLRYEYRQNPSTIPNNILFATGSGSTDHILALEGIYAPNWQWELYGKFALRNSRTNLASDLLGSSTVTLSQFRATYRFDYSWDVSAEGRFINQPSTGYSETGFSLEAGYYLTPNLRLSAGYAFGNANDRDLGTRSASGPYIGLTVKINELFNGFGLQKVAPPQQKESEKPIATTSDAKPIAVTPDVKPADVKSGDVK
jgi:hypothetical protein